MDRLLEIINRFPDVKVGVMGDLILDHYLVCDVDRISQEAPVPIAKVQSEHYVLGGAANVAMNIRSLGGKAEVFGLIGMDQNGDELIKLLDKGGIEYGLSFRASKRPTTTKTRLTAGGQQMARIDKESDEPISSEEEQRIMKRIPQFLDRVNVVVLSDYAKGLLSENLVRETILLARERGIKVLSDPKPESYQKYKDSYLIKPNRKEAENISRMRFSPDLSNMYEIVRSLREKLNSNLVVSMGKDGMILADSGEILRMPTMAREVYDVSGAGDTVMAALALGISGGGDLKTATLLANYAAGIAVGKTGTAAVSIQELLDSIHEKGVFSYV